MSPGDHLKSLPTFFFNDLYKIQYFGICISINPELVHSPLYSPPPSFSSFVDGPQRGLVMLWALQAPLSKLTQVHLWLWVCGQSAWAQAEGQRLMCSTMLKRLGQQLPLLTGMHLWHSSHGSRAQPAPAPAWASLQLSWESFYYGKGIF